MRVDQGFGVEMSSAPVTETLPLLSAAAIDPPLTTRSPHRLGLLPLIAEAGRVTAVVLPVLVVYVAARPFAPDVLPALALLVAVWLATLRSAAGAGQGQLGAAPTLAVGSVTGLVAVAALDPWFPGLQLGPAFLLGMTAGVFVSSAVWERAVRLTSVGRRRVLVVGTDRLSDAMADELERAGIRGLGLVARVAAGDEEPATGTVPLLGVLAELEDVVRAQRPDLIVLTDEGTYADAADRLLDIPDGRFRVVGLAGFFEVALGRVPLEQITPAWFLSLLHPRQRVYTRFAKRTFDVLAAAVGLLVVAPLLPLLALLTKTTRGPVLYRQTRMGEAGEPFTIYKFRTMTSDVEADGPELASFDDPRTTGVGRILRRTHLDELPQLWNVLKGEMSIVGPRPERPEFIDSLEEAVPFWNRRLLVKPGITGWAQVRCEYGVDVDAMARKLSYDLWYLRHRSLLVDFAICVETALDMLRRPQRA
jgi:exopolysaccharide biosynthesis polyprenyl glycosylphosphotransferase